MTSPILNELLQRATALRSLARELVGDARADDILQEAAIQSMTAPPKRLPSKPIYRAPSPKFWRAAG